MNYLNCIYNCENNLNCRTFAFLLTNAKGRGRIYNRRRDKNKDSPSRYLFYNLFYLSPQRWQKGAEYGKSENRENGGKKF